MPCTRATARADVKHARAAAAAPRAGGIVVCVVVYVRTRAWGSKRAPCMIARRTARGGPTRVTQTLLRVHVQPVGNDVIYYCITLRLVTAMQAIDSGGRCSRRVMARHQECTFPVARVVTRPHACVARLRGGESRMTVG